MKKKVIYIIILVIFFLLLASIFTGIETKKVQLGTPLSLFGNVKSPLLQKAIIPEKVSEVTDGRQTNFIVGSVSYPVSTAVGGNIYEVMNTLSSTTAFRFTAKYYQGLGYFIEEINGIKNKDGYYWTLYVNEVYSTVGVSDYILKEGDQIEWKLEKK
jgi:hypothetical protein